MASDSQVSWGDNKVIDEVPKIRRVAKGVLVGAAGDSAWCNSVVNTRGLAAWDEFCENGNIPKGCELLTVSEGYITIVDYPWSLTIPHTYAAIGAGAAYALGSLASTLKLPKRTGKWHVTAAVEAAIRHSTTCGGPVQCLSVGT
jgi:ATP-dependent protease HslVU (ClpYQ) peptidase subunit